MYTKKKVVVRDEFDYNKSDYWVGQKVTIPAFLMTPSSENYSMTKSDFKKFINTPGKIALITGIDCDIDGTVSGDLFNFRMSYGFEFTMRFDIFPKEIASKLGYYGIDIFGKKMIGINYKRP